MPRKDVLSCMTYENLLYIHRHREPPMMRGQQMTCTCIHNFYFTEKCGYQTLAICLVKKKILALLYTA